LLKTTKILTPGEKAAWEAHYAIKGGNAPTAPAVTDYKTDLSSPLSTEEIKAANDYAWGEHTASGSVAADPLNQGLRDSAVLDPQLRDIKLNLDTAIGKSTLKQDTPVFRTFLLTKQNENSIGVNDINQNHC